ELVLRHLVGLHHVDVEIAVAHVAEERNLPPWITRTEDSLELACERLEARDGQRHVVLVRQSGRGEALADALAESPQICGFARVLREHAVPREAAFEDGGEPTLERPAVRSFDLEQHVTARRGREWRAERAVTHHALEAVLRKEFVRADREGPTPGRLEEPEHG